VRSHGVFIDFRHECGSTSQPFWVFVRVAEACMATALECGLCRVNAL